MRIIARCFSHPLLPMTIAVGDEPEGLWGEVVDVKVDRRFSYGL